MLTKVLSFWAFNKVITKFHGNLRMLYNKKYMIQQGWKDKSKDKNKENCIFYQLEFIKPKEVSSLFL